MAQPARRTFYGRELPEETCTELASPLGQAIFADAMATNGTGCFFHLMQQFRTQDEPAYCGISTLVMVLNALRVDPGKVWKGVWKWWAESMFDCCVSLEEAKQSGITLDEFVCLARCQGVAVSAVRPPPVGDMEVVQTGSTNSVDAFRETVKSVTGGNGSAVLIISYSRKMLGQTGSGHFSPIGAYDSASDRVLILDVARFKYPAHWVDLNLVYESLRALDSSTGKPRGWAVMSTSLDSNRHLLPFMHQIMHCRRGSGCGTGVQVAAGVESCTSCTNDKVLASTESKV